MDNWPYCSCCGKRLYPKDITYPGPELFVWAKQYKEAKELSKLLPDVPKPPQSNCCGCVIIRKPDSIIEAHHLMEGAERIESHDFQSLIKFCHAIGKNPTSIQAHLILNNRTRCLLSAPSVYYIDVKAKWTKNRIEENLQLLLT